MVRRRPDRQPQPGACKRAAGQRRSAAGGLCALVSVNDHRASAPARQQLGRGRCTAGGYARPGRGTCACQPAGPAGLQPHRQQTRLFCCMLVAHKQPSEWALGASLRPWRRVCPLLAQISQNRNV